MKPGWVIPWELLAILAALVAVQAIMWAIDEYELAWLPMVVFVIVGGLAAMVALGWLVASASYWVLQVCCG